MQLYHLEDAMMGQFIWAKKSEKIMQTNDEVEASPDTALVVFCGLSEMYGFSQEEVCDYLVVDQNEYFRYLKMFRGKMSDAYERMKIGEWDYEKQDMVQKVYIKSRLVHSKVSLSSGSTRFELSEFPNA